MLAQGRAVLDPFVGALAVQVHVDAHAASRWLIPPVVLPELRENAVTHHDFTTDNPLQIEIRLEGDRLTVSLEKRPRKATVSSTGVGLENLAQRFRLTTGVAARWAETGGRFVVTLPLMATHGANIAQ